MEAKAPNQERIYVCKQHGDLRVWVLNSIEIAQPMRAHCNINDTPLVLPAYPLAPINCGRPPSTAPSIA